MELPLGLRAGMRVEPLEQQDPWQGDGLVVQAQLFLPDNPKYSAGLELHPHLKFGDRLVLLSDALQGAWGFKAESLRCRVNRQNFVADTWRQATDEACACLRAEVEKLRAALEKRLAALHSEGCELLAVKNLIEGAGR